MSKLVRLPLILLVVLGLAFLWTWPATAENDVIDPVDVVEEVPAVPGDEAEEPGGAETVAEPAGEGPAPAAPVEEEPASSPADDGAGPGRAYTYGSGATSSGAVATDSESNAEESEGGAAADQSSEPEESDEAPGGSDQPDPEAVGECLAGVVGQLISALEGLGTDIEEQGAAIEDALASGDPLELASFLEDLGVALEEIPTESQAAITQALTDAGECLTATDPDEEEPPTNGGGQNPPPTARPGVQETYYEDCDDARAKGAAPVYAGQPGYRPGLDSDNDGIGCETDTGYAAQPTTTGTSGTLAYTGVDVESFVLAGLILLSSGTLLSLAGASRA